MWSHLQRYICLHSFHNLDCSNEYGELPWLPAGLVLGHELDLLGVPLLGLLVAHLDQPEFLDVVHYLRHGLAPDHGDQGHDQCVLPLPDHL